MPSEDTPLCFPHLAMTFSFGDSIRTYTQTANTSGMERSVRGDRLVIVMCQVSKRSEGLFLSFAICIRSTVSDKHHKPNKHFELHKIKAAPFFCAASEDKL